MAWNTFRYRSWDSRFVKSHALRAEMRDGAVLLYVTFRQPRQLLDRGRTSCAHLSELAARARMAVGELLRDLASEHIPHLFEGLLEEVADGLPRGQARRHTAVHVDRKDHSAGTTPVDLVTGLMRHTPVEGAELLQPGGHALFELDDL